MSDTCKVIGHVDGLDVIGSRGGGSGAWEQIEGADEREMTKWFDLGPNLNQFFLFLNLNHFFFNFYIYSPCPSSFESSDRL